jgi:hypothetical protein
MITLTPEAAVTGRCATGRRGSQHRLLNNANDTAALERKHFDITPNSTGGDSKHLLPMWRYFGGYY